MSIKELVEISRFYGADPDFLLAGGGNTSLKDGSILYVKASGYKLASISKEGFVKLDMYALNKIWTKNYSSDADSREKEVLKDLMNSRVRGEDKRPSVESLLHAVLPQKYIVHTHPALVNGITCSRKSRRMTGRLFGSRCMWVPSVNPGYVLAKLIKDMLEKHKKKHGTDPDIIMLENHGMFAGAGTTFEIKSIHEYVISILKKHVTREPDFSPIQANKKDVEKIFGLLKNYHAFRNWHIIFENNTEISNTVKNNHSFKKVQIPYTPDHIVYAGPEMLFVDDVDLIEQSIDNYKKRNNCFPRIVALKNTGVFTLGESRDSSKTAMLLFIDALKISVYAESFGGAKFMNKEQIDFIKNWEVEKFRSKISQGNEK